MSSIQIKDYLEESSGDKVSDTLCFTVIAIGKKRTFMSKNQKEIQMWSVAIGDNTGACKMYVYNEAQIQKLQPLKSYLMKFFTPKTTHITTNNDTKFFRSQYMVLPRGVLDEGNALLHPEKPEHMTVDQAKKSPMKKRVSVEGKIVNVSFNFSLLSEIVFQHVFNNITVLPI